MCESEGVGECSSDGSVAHSQSISSIDRTISGIIPSSVSRERERRGERERERGGEGEGRGGERQLLPRNAAMVGSLQTLALRARADAERGFGRVEESE